MMQIWEKERERERERKSLTSKSEKCKVNITLIFTFFPPILVCTQSFLAAGKLSYLLSLAGTQCIIEIYESMNMKKRVWERD